FARAGGTEQGGQFTVIEGEADIIHSDEVAKTLVYLIDFNAHCDTRFKEESQPVQWEWPWPRCFSARPVRGRGRSHNYRRALRSPSHSTRLFTAMVTSASPVNSEDT